MPASRERLSVRDFFVNGINGTTNLRDLPVAIWVRMTLSAE